MKRSTSGVITAMPIASPTSSGPDATNTSARLSFSSAIRSSDRNSATSKAPTAPAASSRSTSRRWLSPTSSLRRTTNATAL